MIVSTLIAGIKSNCGIFLGPTFSEVNFGIDIEHNRSKQASKGYAVLPESATQEDSIGALVMDQNFRVRLTDTFNPGKTGDSNVQTTTNSLYDKVYALYEYLVNNKCGVPASVLNTYGLEVSSPLYLEDGVVILELTFTIKHRT